MVGVMGTVCVAGLVGASLWLRNALTLGKENHFVVRLPDARGLKGAEEVRIAGFKVGRVGKVGLSKDGRAAEVELLVDAKYPIAKDAKIQVNPPLLGGVVYVSIVPGTPGVATLKDGEMTTGQEAAGLDALAAGANRLVGDPKMQEDLKATVAAVRESTESLKNLLADPNLKKALGGVGQASEQLPRVMDQTHALLGRANTMASRLEETVRRLGSGADRAMGNVSAATRSGAGAAREAERTIKTANATLQENRESIKALLRSANDAAAGMAALMDQAAGLVAEKDLKKNLVSTTANIDAATKNVVEVTRKLDATMASVQKAAGDEQLLGDVKATLGNIKEASASIQRLAARIEKIRLPGEKGTPAEGPSVPPVPTLPGLTTLLEPGLTLDSVYDTKGERYRLDAGYTLLTRDQRGFYRVGVSDATEADRLNFQLGAFGKLPATSAMRYGLFAGKLGAGVDVRSGGLDWRLDVFNPNRMTVNLRAKRYLDPNTALLMGLESVGNGNRATVGVQVRR
jgi:ABC-type transporter Mla subunit MlaD